MRDKENKRTGNSRIKGLELANLLEGIVRYRKWEYEQKQEVQAETKEATT